METIFVYWLPLILNIALAVFLRTCTELRNEARMPRVISYLIVIVGFVPIVSWICACIGIILIIIMIVDDDLILRNNKFTRYWFKS